MIQRLVLIVGILAASAQAQTLTGIQPASGPGTGTLVAFPVGNFQWSMRFHSLPTTPPVSDLYLIKFNADAAGNQFVCKIDAGTTSLSCYSPFGAPGGAASIPLNGATDIRVTYSRYVTSGTGCSINGVSNGSANCSQERIDFWKGDCSGYQWTNMPIDYNSATVSNYPYQIGGSTFYTDFFRAEPLPGNNIALAPTCPADSPPTNAPNMDYRFEGNSISDQSGHGYTLAVTASACPGGVIAGCFGSSPTYNPAAIITTSSTSGLPVFPSGQNFTLTSASITFDTASNNSVPNTFSWSSNCGIFFSFGSSSSATTTAQYTTASGSSSCIITLGITDASSNSNSTNINIGTVPVNSNSIITTLPITASPAETSYIVGPIPIFGSSPWPWEEATELGDVTNLTPYWQSVPAPATYFTGSGTNDLTFTGRGLYAGAPTDVVQVKISSTGTPDQWEWRVNGGSWSAAQNVQSTNCWGYALPQQVVAGIAICFNATTGHTLGDMWTRAAPLAGTATVSGTGDNKVDSTTGQIVSNNSGACGGQITVVGSGTLWKTGAANTQAVNTSNLFWIEWNYTGSNQDGRFYQQITSVTDDTHLCLGGNGGSWPIPASQSSGMAIQVTGSDFGLEYTGIGQPNSSLNYYEAGLGLVRFALATNLQAYNTLAQEWCNTWWQYGLDHGYNIPISRNSGWHTLMACASMFGTQSNWFGAAINTVSHTPGSGIAYNLTYRNGLNPGTPSDRYTLPAGDIRETAFLTRAAAIFTHVYPPYTGSPSTTTSTWCGYTENLANNVWLNPWNPPTTTGLYAVINSGQDAYWEDASYGTGDNMSSPNAGTPPGSILTASMGTSPWRDSGLSNIGIYELQRIMANPSDCNQSALATSLNTTQQKASAYIWDYGRSPDGGLFYNEGYPSYGSNWSGTDSFHNDEARYADYVQALVVSGTGAVTSGNPATGLILKTGGTGYTSATALATTGPGTGLTITITASGGAITGGTIVSQGSTYNNGDVVTVTQGGASGGAFTVMGANGGNSNFVRRFKAGNQITLNSTNYSISTVTDSGHMQLSGSGFSIPSAIAVYRNGIGYTTASGLVTTGGSGTGLTVNITASGGGIASGTINAAGSGYSDGDVVTVTQGGASGGQFQLTVVAGGYGGGSWNNPATIAATNGSATVVGTGTNFTRMFNCNGTDYIGILGASADYYTSNSGNGVYLVASCADDTHLTLSVPFAAHTNLTTQNDFSWSATTPSGSGCSPSILSIGCEADEYNGKALAADWAVSLGITYSNTSSPTWYTRLQYGLGSLMGGGQGGPSFYLPNFGPQSTLATGNFDAIFPGCNQTGTLQAPFPCSSDPNAGSGHFAKEFGMWAGAGDGRNAIAYYLMTGISAGASNSVGSLGISNGLLH